MIKKKLIRQHFPLPQGRGKKNCEKEFRLTAWVDPTPPKWSGKCEIFLLWLLTLVYDYIWLFIHFIQQIFFLTTDPPLPSLAAATRKKIGICQNFLTWPYETTLTMHFSASSQWSKICFGYQGIIFNGKKGLTFSQIVLVRLEGGDPPSPQSGQPDRFSQYFLPLPLIRSCVEK